jgi:Alpha/beta hydrolase domain
MRLATAISAAAILMSAAAQARVVRIEITHTEPFADGQGFGETGPYEKVVGRFYGEIDPALPLNAGIVDIDKAPRNVQGRVEYAADFYILKPADLARGNGALLYDVNNRGNKRALIAFNSAPASNDPNTPEQAGNGFLMQQGYTVVFSGWIPGLPAADHALRLEVPAATAGDPIEQAVWDEFLFNDTTTMQANLSFPATNPADAKLLVRAANTQEPNLVSADRWEFVDARTIRLLPAGTPFRIGAIYQLIYHARNPPVAGIGFAATRDLVSFLRRQATDDHGTANPLASSGRSKITRTLAHGTSQSGRYLRDFVHRGFNEDEEGRIVFDGINPHVATGRLFLNFRFAQPNRMMQIGHGFQFFPDVSFPFAYGTEADRLTGKRDGILARCAARGNCPKIIHTTTSTEYWESGGSLVTTDPMGKYDAALPDNVRVYHFASTQHVGVQATMPKGVCAMPPNRTDYTPLMRAALLNLDRWIKDGVEPPPSRYPRIADGSLVPMIDPPKGIPGFTLAKGPSPRPLLDYGTAYDRGVVERVLPETRAESYGVLVPKMDRDGNEEAGIRLPEIAVPTGTATGWSVRSADAGGAGELCYLDGSFLPFATTRAEREASGDPRPSLAERYGEHARFVKMREETALALVREGYLLDADAERSVSRAENAPW